MKDIKIIIVSVFCLCCGSLSIAQDMTVVHLKDGSQLKFPNGQAGETVISFWANTSLEQDKVGQVYYSLLKKNEDYIAKIDWYSYYFPTIKSDVVLCIGMAKNPTVETANVIVPVTNAYDKYSYTVELGDDYPLEKGQTYYFRIVSRTPYLQGGEQQTAYVYGRENSFRVPLLMGESGMIPAALAASEAIYPNSEAWAAFNQQYFPEISEQRLWALPRLWMEWIADHQAEVTVSSDKTFDDGVLHLVGTIPKSFYTWMTNREIVINSPEYIKSITNGQLDTLVTNVDEKWQIPGNSYMQFGPQKSTSNATVTYDVSEAIPGINYKMQIVFAPETIADPNEDTNSFKPTKLRIDGSTVDANNQSTSGSLDNNENHIVQATEVTTLTFDNVINLTDVVIKMNMLARESAQYKRIIRLAEIRLIP